jgi:hypothetical protein
MSHNSGMSQGLGMTGRQHVKPQVEMILGIHRKAEPAEISRWLHPSKKRLQGKFLAGGKFRRFYVIPLPLGINSGVEVMRLVGAVYI